MQALKFFANMRYMNVITISHKLAKGGDLVVIPRCEYEALLKLRKIREFNPTLLHKKTLAKAEHNLVKGKTLSYYGVAHTLGFTN